MSRKILLYFFLISTFLTSSVYAASYGDGEAAYKARDYKKAVSIWEELAEEGDIASQLKMAKMYSTGSWVKIDKAASFELYNQAAEQGSVEALFELGVIYMSGQGGVKRDRAKARELYLKAANQGYAKAQYYYGITYFRGEGVTTDYVQAHAWLHVAVVRGYEHAKAYREQLAAVLSKADLKKSKNISDQLLAKIKKAPAGKGQ